MEFGLQKIKRTLLGPHPRLLLTKVQRFSPEEARDFHFFQFNVGNTRFFYQEAGVLHPRMDQIPHFRVALQSVSGDPEAVIKAKSDYLEYLRYSWPSYGFDTAEDRLKDKYDNFLDYVRRTKEAGKLSGPIVLTRVHGFKGYHVVDGNHRCAIACALGLPVPAKIIDFGRAFDTFMSTAEFYGTGNRDMPYQSLYLDKTVVRKGRRADIYDRLSMIPAAFLKEKRVLDVGCNIGMNAIGAYKCGAKSVLGLEISRTMANYATRFSVFDNCYPHVSFRQYDVDNDNLMQDEVFDVAFMLAVHNHLRRPEALIEIAKDHVRQAIVFEGHPSTKYEDYPNFFAQSGFSSVEKVGDLHTSVFQRNSSRPVWICHKKKAHS